jgi:hypothetical protein
MTSHAIRHWSALKLDEALIGVTQTPNVVALEQSKKSPPYLSKTSLWMSDDAIWVRSRVRRRLCTWHVVIMVGNPCWDLRVGKRCFLFYYEIRRTVSRREVAGNHGQEACQSLTQDARLSRTGQAIS